MSTLKTNTIQAATGTTVNVASGQVFNAPGHVLQVQQKVLLTRVTVASNTYTDALVADAITPSSTSSKILVTVAGTLGNSNTGNNSSLKLFRGSTEIGSGTGGDTYNTFVTIFTAENYQMLGFSQSFLDSPNTTSATTYKIQMAAFNATASLGSRGDSTSVQNPTTITLMEIAG